MRGWAKKNLHEINSLFLRSGPLLLSWPILLSGIWPAYENCRRSIRDRLSLLLLIINTFSLLPILPVSPSLSLIFSCCAFFHQPVTRLVKRRGSRHSFILKSETDTKGRFNSLIENPSIPLPSVGK